VIAVVYVGGQTKSSAQGSGARARHADGVALAQGPPGRRTHRRGGLPAGSISNEEIHASPSKWWVGTERRASSSDAPGIRALEPAQQRPGLLGHAVVRSAGLPLSALRVLHALPGRGGGRRMRCVQRLSEVLRGPVHAVARGAPCVLGRATPCDDLGPVLDRPSSRRRREGGPGFTGPPPAAAPARTSIVSR
jgi:hypothetical protein